MATKLQLITDLYGDTAKQVTDSVDGWKSYLTSAARLYKYTFDELLLPLCPAPRRHRLRRYGTVERQDEPLGKTRQQGHCPYPQKRQRQAPFRICL